ncbi:hypothetical protein RclHR1_03150018 [Rhizophagus clarus]|uniref:G-protein coupled receptors family 2 profile 2 domain-containing protein n=1 Tax=Rhizophagus clarus TaxID=94130 RepID=A0A2Z6R7H8_9GLOM|nr:hypothetical protein RclHR1_03150018 [Rhizophagus clarus]
MFREIVACVEYFKDGVCSNYIAETEFVYLKENKTVESIENSLGDILIVQGLAILNDVETKKCVEDFTKYICATIYPKCTLVANTQQANVIIPCKSTCTNAITSCNNIEQPSQIVQDILSLPTFPRNCSGLIKQTSPLNIEYPISNCDPLLQIKDEPRCFSPLVVDIAKVKSDSDTLNADYCHNGCCVPCPQSYNLYPQGYYVKGIFAAQIIKSISAIFSGFVLISYIILPKRRSHPSIMLLFISLSIFLYSSNVFFSIFNQKKIQCVDNITPSTQENNTLCAIQGAFLIFAAQASTIWAGIVMLNFHLHTVWDSNLLANKYIYIHLIAWGIPSLLTLIALTTASIKYQFGGFCTVAINIANELYFYPMLTIVIPSFLIHLYTSYHIFKSSKTSLTNSTLLSNIQHNQIIESLRIQSHAFLLVILLTIIVLFYWLFYFFNVKKIVEYSQNNEFLVKWLTCIQSGKGQNICSEISKNYMPSFFLLIAAEIINSLIGFILFGLFTNNIFWNDWNSFIKEKLSRSLIKKVEMPEQFFTI